MSNPFTLLANPNPCLRGARFMLITALAFLLACDAVDSPDDQDGLEPDPGITHATVRVNGIDLHYATMGQGDPVVLLPGWPQTWYQWRHVMPLLADSYTVIAPDLRGMGESSRPDEGYDKKTLAEDIHALVQELGYTRVSMVGHDIGGMVAYAYASLYPGEVERVAFLDSPIPGDMFFQLPALSPQGGIWWFGLHALPELPEELIAGRERLYISWFFRNLAVHPEAFSEADIDQYAEAVSRPGALAAGFEYYRAFFQDIEDNRVFAEQPLTMPVLAIGGAGSTGTLIADMLQPLAQDVTGVVLEDSGHWLAEEQPAALAMHLRQFLAR